LEGLGGPAAQPFFFLVFYPAFLYNKPDINLKGMTPGYEKQHRKHTPEKKAQKAYQGWLSDIRGSSPAYRHCGNRAAFSGVRGS
jgi:hypothetical protein